MNKSVRRGLALCISCVNLLSMNEGFAQPVDADQQPPPPDVQLAHEMADKAFELYNEKKWSEAFETFEKAEGIVHSAEFILHMARCQEKQGDLLEAAKLYRWIIAEEPHPKTKPGYKRALTNARIAAKEELAQLNTRIPTIQVRVQGANGRFHRLTVGGVPRVPIDAPIPVNPDKSFWVVLWYGEGHSVARLLKLAAGDRKDLVIPMPPEVPEVTVAPRPAPVSKTKDEKSDVAWKAFLVTTMAGGVAGMGLILAGVGLNAKASEAWASCPPITCSDEQQRAREDLDTSETLSAVGIVTLLGFPLAGGLLAAGLSTKKSAVKPIALGISPNGFTVRGTF